MIVENPMQPISTVEDGVSEVNLEVVLRVAHVTEDMTGKCSIVDKGAITGESLNTPCMTQTNF